MKGSFSRTMRWSLLYFFIVLALAWALAPIIWMAISSLKTEEGMFSLPPKLVFKPTLESYRYMFSARGHYLEYLKNSALASLLSTVISVVLGSIGGFALARANFRKEKDISFWIISTRMAPIPAVILPLYIMLGKIGMVGNMSSLLVAYTTFNLPFALWMMMVFFREVPVDIEEAATIDGCSQFRAFIEISLPTATPGFVATAVLCLMFSWNDYMFASVFSGASSQTIPVAASLLVTQHGISWGQAMATGTIIIFPMLICGLAVRKYLVRGLSMGAIK